MLRRPYQGMTRNLYNLGNGKAVLGLRGGVPVTMREH